MVLNLDNCTGCSACFAGCKKKAIKMLPSAEGFLYPKIDETLCVDCRYCISICPQQKEKKNSSNIPDSYLFIHDDEKIRMTSSSGGAFTALAEKILEKRGVVYGAAFDEEYKVVHTRVDASSDLYKLQRSKYVQSNMMNSFELCKKDLQENRFVLFVGTACQIAGLKSFLGKDYSNLYSCDFICHGTPSAFLWEKYLDYQKSINESGVKTVFFRDKSLGWHSHSLFLEFADGRSYLDTHEKGPYLLFFLRDYGLRESCYKCNHKTIERVSDFTLADFWGLEKEYPELDDNKGASFISIHSQKGKEFFSQISCAYKKSIPFEVGLKHNTAMIESAKRPMQRECFYKDLNSYPFNKLIKKYLNNNIGKRVFRYMKRKIGR